MNLFEQILTGEAEAKEVSNLRSQMDELKRIQAAIDKMPEGKDKEEAKKEIDAVTKDLSAREQKTAAQATSAPAKSSEQPQAFYKGNEQTGDFKFDTELGAKDQSTPAKAQPQQAQAKPQQPATSSVSLVDYLNQTGQKSDRASRNELAKSLGIQNYQATAEQNTQMLNMLKSGKTGATAQQPTQQQPTQQKGMGGAVGAVSKGVGSVGQGIKQATIGTKKPLGGILGGISKGLGTVGKGVKTALVGNQDQKSEAEEEKVKKNYKKDENCEDCALNKITVREKVNISKFLKHLSEKNYSSAHKYLKAIVDEKIQRNLMNRIAKN